MVGVRQAYRQTVNGRLKKGRPATEKELKWSCPACSFLNHTLINYCEICETQRKDSDEDDELEALSPTHLHATSAAAGHSRSSAGSSPPRQATSSRAGAAQADSSIDEGFYVEHMPMLLEMFASLGEDVVRAECVALEAEGVQDMEICVRQLLERSNSQEADGAATRSSGSSSQQRASMPVEDASSEDLRPCPLCSFLNPASRTACEICEAICLPPVAPRSSAGSSSALRSNNSGNAAAPKRGVTAGKKRQQADRNSARERREVAAPPGQLSLAEEEEFVTPESSPRQRTRVPTSTMLDTPSESSQRQPRKAADHGHAASADHSAAGSGSTGANKRRTAAAGSAATERSATAEDRAAAEGSVAADGSAAADGNKEEEGKLRANAAADSTSSLQASAAGQSDPADALAADGKAAADDSMAKPDSEVDTSSGTATSAPASRPATRSAGARSSGTRSSAANKLEHRTTPAHATSPGSTGDTANTDKKSKDDFRPPSRSPHPHKDDFRPPSRSPHPHKVLGPPPGLTLPDEAKVEQPGAEPPATADDKERQLLLSMGWVPDDDDDEGGLEEWEIDAAQESFIEHLQGQPREGLRERAQREFEAWKAEQTTRESSIEPSAAVVDSRSSPAGAGCAKGSTVAGRTASSSTAAAEASRRAGQQTVHKRAVC